MNSMTQPSKQPYHHVIIGKCTEDGKEFVTLCILNGNGYGGYDHWIVDKLDHERVSGIIGNHYFQDYWQDYVTLEVIQNIYTVLDFYVKVEDNVVDINTDITTDSNFCEEDIPF